MPHIRETLRDTFKDALTGITVVATRVYSNRVDPYLTLPSVNVLTQGESVRYDMSAMNTVQVRELTLTIEGRVDAATIPEDGLDTIANEIEEAIESSSAINALAFDVTLGSTSFSYTSDGVKSIGLLEMQYNLLYQTDGTDPSTIV